MFRGYDLSKNSARQTSGVTLLVIKTFRRTPLLFGLLLILFANTRRVPGYLMNLLSIHTGARSSARFLVAVDTFIKLRSPFPVRGRVRRFRRPGIRVPVVLIPGGNPGDSRGRLRLSVCIPLRFIRGHVLSVSTPGITVFRRVVVPVTNRVPIFQFLLRFH